LCDTFDCSELNVTAAINVGSELVGEIFIIAVALSLMIFESKRSSRESANKSQVLDNRLQNIENEIEKQRVNYESFYQFVENNHLLKQ
jgi:hypothetical protein